MGSIFPPEPMASEITYMNSVVGFLSLRSLTICVSVSLNIASRTHLFILSTVTSTQ